MSYPGPATSALLLSGGESQRFGGEPKALLDVRGEPAILRMHRIVQRFGLEPIVVAEPPHPTPLEDLVWKLGCEVVHSDRSLRGRTASIQEGLARLPAKSDVLLWPVDHSFVGMGTIQALLAARDRDPVGRWFVPKHEGRGGHPVLIGHEVLPRIALLQDHQPLRHLLPMLGPLVVSVPVPDVEVAEPIDTPEVYRRAQLRAEPPEVAWTHG